MAKRILITNSAKIKILLAVLIMFSAASLFSLHTWDIKVHKSANQNNVQIKTKPQMICNPTYLIAKISVHWHIIDDGFLNGGFVANCTPKEEESLGINEENPIYRRMQGRCFKYDPASDFNAAFCNGGRLIWKGNKEDQIFFKRFTSKANLNSLLRAYCYKFHSNDNDCGFWLESFDMGVKQERIEFLSKHIDCENDKPQYDNTWVFKENKHFGAGVHFNNNHQLIYRLIISSEQESIKNCSFNPLTEKSYFKTQGFNFHKIKTINEETAYVVNRKGLLMQPFVYNPLLLEKPNESTKHAFHVRSFFFIASYVNPLIVLHWPKFLLFVNPNEYENKEKLNKAAIITNRNAMLQQTADDRYEWIWGPTELQYFIDNIYGKDMFDGNYASNKLQNDIKHMIKIIFSANAFSNERNKMDSFQQRKYVVDENDFELNIDELCLDILIDDQFELKLTEVNMFCGFACNETKIINKKQSGIYDWDCDGWRQETMQIVAEVFRKKLFNMTIQNIDALKDYEIAYWEK